MLGLDEDFLGENGKRETTIAVRVINQLLCLLRRRDGKIFLSFAGMTNYKGCIVDCKGIQQKLLRKTSY